MCPVPKAQVEDTSSQKGEMTTAAIDSAAATISWFIPYTHPNPHAYGSQTVTFVNRRRVGAKAD
jgi:hypothetical protein